jgi:tetratricopeptide (TPR) repeat protein
MKYLDAAAKLGGDQALLLATKGSVYYSLGAWSDALTAYRSSLASAGFSASIRLVKNCYLHFFIWLILARQNQTAQANQDLSAFVAANPGIWEYPWLGSICQFLLGNISEADFYAVAHYPVHYYDLQRRAEVQYYSGMRRLLAGNQSGAISAFKKCLAVGDIGIAEMVFSKWELKRLGVE